MQPPAVSARADGSRGAHGQPNEEELLVVDDPQPWESFEPFRSLGKGVMVEAQTWADYAGEEVDVVEAEMPSYRVPTASEAVHAFDAFEGLHAEVAMVEEPAMVNANVEPLPISEVAPATSALYALNPELVSSLTHKEPAAEEHRPYRAVGLNETNVFTVAPTVAGPAEHARAPPPHATHTAAPGGSAAPVSFVEEAPKMVAGRVEGIPEPAPGAVEAAAPRAGPLGKEAMLEAAAALGAGRVATRALAKYDPAKGPPGARVAPGEVDIDHNGRFDNFEYAKLDADSNGAVSVKEAAALLGPYLARELDGSSDGWVTFSELLRGLDANGDLTLAIDELVSVVRHLTAAEHERYIAQVQSAFAAYAQGAPSLAPGRLGALLEQEFRFAPGMLSLAFLEMDLNGDRAVSLDEYQDAMEDLFATGALSDYQEALTAE